MTEAVLFLVKAILDLLSVGVLITFFFRLFRVDYYNPIVQGIMRITKVLTSGIQKIVKPIFGLDFSALLIVIFLQVFAFYLLTLAGSVAFNAIAMVSWALYSTLLLSLRMIWWALLVGVIMSWISPMNTHPAMKLIQQMSDQICKPFRVILPPMGGLDFTPILAFLFLQFLQIAIRNLSLNSGLPIGLSVGF